MFGLCWIFNPPQFTAGLEHLEGGVHMTCDLSTEVIPEISSCSRDPHELSKPPLFLPFNPSAGFWGSWGFSCLSSFLHPWCPSTLRPHPWLQSAPAGCLRETPPGVLPCSPSRPQPPCSHSTEPRSHIVAQQLPPKQLNSHVPCGLRGTLPSPDGLQTPRPVPAVNPAECARPENTRIYT